MAVCTRDGRCSPKGILAPRKLGGGGRRLRDALFRPGPGLALAALKGQLLRPLRPPQPPLDDDDEEEEDQSEDGDEASEYEDEWEEGDQDGEYLPPHAAGGGVTVLAKAIRGGLCQVVVDKALLQAVQRALHQAKKKTTKKKKAKKTTTKKKKKKTKKTSSGTKQKRCARGSHGRKKGRGSRCVRNRVAKV